MVLINHDLVIKNPLELWSNCNAFWLSTRYKLVIKRQLTFVIENLWVFKYRCALNVVLNYEYLGPHDL